MSFFEMCQVESSPFDIEFARQDPDWIMVRDAYDNNLSRNDQDCEIPKIIHFIWVGSKLPEKYAKIIEGWKHHNPDFEIWLWDDEKVETFLPQMYNKDLYLRAPSFGNKSDILRYEILKRYGGVYVDTDFVCLASFAHAHRKYCFYAGILYERPVQLGNGIIASVPNHPIIDICIQQMRLDNPWGIQCPQTLVLYQTGPWALTKSVLHYIKHMGDEGIMIYPTTSFHAFPAVLRHEATDELIESYYRPWSLACHLWHSSWQPSSEHYNG